MSIDGLAISISGAETLILWVNKPLNRQSAKVWEVKYINSLFFLLKKIAKTMIEFMTEQSLIANISLDCPMTYLQYLQLCS